MVKDKVKENKFLKTVINMKEIGCGIICMDKVKWFMLMAISIQENGYLEEE